MRAAWRAMSLLIWKAYREYISVPI
jgi:hypothetical protein